ncbi:MAG: MFS transporter [Gammaproteobacteria bacterium]|nr:MAG: MFS transporter [Gammaproteobacteria bacterium]
MQANKWFNERTMLMIMSIIMPLTFSTWHVLLNNFALEQAAYTGADIGLLQSVREIPGFLAFTVVLLLLIVKEQILALISLAVLSIGVALTGFFPSSIGLLATTFLMSMGFHYFETIKNSLVLQWIPKADTPYFLGKLLAIGSMSSLFVYSSVWVLIEKFSIAFQWIYLVAGGIGLVLVLFISFAYPAFKTPVEQTKKLFLRKRYWLYYVLVFLSGARRQIFIVFAGFLMVEKFGYSAADISLLFLLNHLINLYVAPKIGKFIAKVGERNALTLEYSGLIVIFLSYAIVESSEVAAMLYVIDHVFFAMAIAIKTYFQKIADPADIASTSGVSFTINHIAAIIIPVTFGLIWLINPSIVFIFGAMIAFASLLFSRKIPDIPSQGNEVIRRLGRKNFI